MIAFLKGRLVEKSPTEVVIDCHGVGYLAHISLNTYSQLGDDENVTLLTYLVVREDAHILYGFMEKMEREVFKLLISVSGIGPNTARNMLSYISPKELIHAIGNEDLATIQKIKGIGLKTAQRMIIELKSKVLKIYDIEQNVEISHNTNAEEALTALEVLGFNRKSVEKIVKKIIDDAPNASVEELIKGALKML